MGLSVKSNSHNAIHEHIQKNRSNPFENVSINLQSIVEKENNKSIVADSIKNSIDTLDPNYREKQEREILPIEEWIDSYQHVGPLIYDLWPSICDDIINIFKDPLRYTEILVTGAIGIGKTSLDVFILSRMVYELSCMMNPALFLRQMRFSTISFALFSINKRKCEKTIFKDVFAYIKTVPYYREMFKWNPELLKEVQFPKGLNVVPIPTNADALASLNPILIIMDEVNLWEQVEASKKVRGLSEAYNAAKSVYDEAKSRQVSRFFKNGVKRAKLLLSCQRVYPDSFLEDIIKDAEDKGRIGKDVYLIDRSQWEAQPKGTFSEKTFRVEIGTEYKNSRILKGDEKDVNQKNVIDVPIDFLDLFETDIDKNIRNIAGKHVLSIKPLFRDKTKIGKAIRNIDDLWPAYTITHPARADSVDFRRQFEFKRDMLINPDLERPQPRINPEKPRFIHIDLGATGDACGFAMSHIYKKVVVHRYDDKSKTIVKELDNFYYVDFFQQITPPPGGEIDFAMVRNIIYELAGMGFYIPFVSYDTWQSRESRQRLIEQGYACEFLSVDKTDEQYMYLKDTFTEERISLYDSDHLMEIQKLERDPRTGKVDHLRGFKKDVADAICGSVWDAKCYGDYYDTADKEMDCRAW
jgi:hypothetical protein